MSWLIKYLLFTLMVIILIVPFVVVAILRIILRKYSFKAHVGGLLSFHSIMMRIPVKMNL